MRIVLDSIGKKFNYEWIFRQFSYTFETNVAYAITGANGSGKSTLLQVIAGIQPSSEGKIHYQLADKILDADVFFQHISIATPYLELVEEFTLTEQIAFHRKFKKIQQNISDTELIEILRLEKSRHKYIRNFSSGMKQRLKLGLAFYSDTAVLMLDEPTSNLDAQNIAWYKEEVLKNRQNRITIICSNQPNEYDFCENIVSLQ